MFGSYIHYSVNSGHKFEDFSLDDGNLLRQNNVSERKFMKFDKTSNANRVMHTHNSAGQKKAKSISCNILKG